MTTDWEQWKREADAYLPDLGEKREEVMSVLATLVMAARAEARLAAFEECDAMFSKRFDLVSDRRSEWVRTMTEAPNYLAELARFTTEMEHAADNVKAIRRLKKAGGR